MTRSFKAFVHEQSYKLAGKLRAALITELPEEPSLISIGGVNVGESDRRKGVGVFYFCHVQDFSPEWEKEAVTLRALPNLNPEVTFAVSEIPEGANLRVTARVWIDGPVDNPVFRLEVLEFYLDGELFLGEESTPEEVLEGEDCLGLLELSDNETLEPTTA